ncbi:hypothetical protein Sjap_019239 [Stephania japonica]|uniref:Protein kinase domain-containing protein n=1 Tax=Stephania japonica TaxID=461633 RepID=A0AAP0HZB4_9MAGN
MFLFLLFFVFLIQVSYGSVDPINFSFASFDSQSCGEDGDLICFGSAVAGDGYLDVTPRLQHTNATSSLGNNVGRVIYKYPVLAWPSTISTSFTVRISKDPNSTGSGDGMAFFMTRGNGPSPVNSYGAFLGLLNRTTNGNMVGQLGVELDTFYNNEFDPDDNHIGLDTTSISSIITASLNNIGINLKLGREVKVKIDYDGWGKMLQISLAYAGAPLVSVLNYSIIMSKTVPSSVYIGFTGSTGIVSESHQILDWSFMSVPLPKYSLDDDQSGKAEKKKIMAITLPVVTGSFVLGICIYLMVKAFRDKSRRRSKEGLEIRSRNAVNAPKMFTLKELIKATQNFNKENLLGTGGFGSVYRGTISGPPSTVAVKKISATSKQGEREFLAEICTIGRLRHKNIVQLLGWCHERDHLLLVYEFMANGSLDRYICKGSLNWQTRYKILTGLASALLYLHDECGNTVIHRDVKPNNVMLDSDFNAHLGDFGLARLLPNEVALTTVLAGTPGYLAPECTYTGKATAESDMFAFGTVVLEVICGRRCRSIIGDDNLVDYVWSLVGKAELLRCVDQNLELNSNEEEVKRALVVGLACAHPDPTFRPTIRKVVQVFTNPNEPLMDLPESRPSAIYITIQSPPSTSSSNFVGSNGTSDSCTSATLPDKLDLQSGR